MPPQPESFTAALPVQQSLSGPRIRLLAACVFVLGLCFAKPLYELGQFALHSDLYSHILLIPFVSAYLVWVKRTEIRGGRSGARGRKLGWSFFIAGVGTVAAFLLFGWRVPLAPVDSLAWSVFSFFLLLVSECCFCLPAAALRGFAFPIGFLIFIVPFPIAVRDGIETFLQHASAEAAELLFGVIGTPLVRTGVAFQLPGFSLQVAPECSGIRSTLVLFITSLIAGQLFLRSPWKRALFALVVIPLGIFRNAIRIVTIGELCVHIDPAFIDSPLHHRGGPVFFAISMIPFLLLLWYLRRTEKRSDGAIYDP